MSAEKYEESFILWQSAARNRKSQRSPRLHAWVASACQAGTRHLGRWGVVLTLTLVFAFISPAFAADYEYSINNGEVTITNYTGTGGAITIPDRIEGYPVTRIGYEAFSWNDSLTSVVIPEGVTSIEEDAFLYSENLWHVSISKSVTSISEGAFYGTSGLTSIVVGSGNPAYSSLDGVLFDKNKTTLLLYPSGKTGGYVIPSSVTSIGEVAFVDSVKLTSVVIPNSVTSIGEGAFAYCKRLAGVSIPASVTNIGAYAFNANYALTGIVVDANNPAYSSNLEGVLFNKNKTTLIQYPPGKTGEYQIPDSVTSIGEGAFNECVKLTGVIIPNSVTSIGESAFYECPGLRDVIIPDSVTSIAGEAFSYCLGLKSLIIPASVINIGSWAFAWNENLSAVYFAGAPPFTDGDNLFEGVYGTAYYVFGTAGWGNQYAGLPTAIWTSQVAFEGNGGTPSYATRIYNVGNPYGQLPTANRPGHVFTGWWSGCEGGSLANVDTTVPLLTQEHTLYARWEQGPVLNTVTFELGGIGWRTGGGELLQEVEPGAAAVEPQVTVAEGWTFERWEGDYTNITSNTTIRAVYSYEQSLRYGWNLISAKLNLVEEAQEALLSRGAITLDANSKAYVSNWELTASQACWIYCQNPTRSTIRLYGTGDANFDFAANLKKGWNFVGPITDSLLMGNGAIAWGWNGQNFEPTESIFSGFGYHLYWPEDQAEVIPLNSGYLIIDLSAGPEAASYPVSSLDEIPAGGWTDEYKTTKLVLRRIPAGTFTMGSPEDELGHQAIETQHQVTLTKDFYVGVFEVTQKQWERVMGSWPSYFSDTYYRDSRPVEQVSYDDIRGNGAGSGWPANNAVDADSFLGRLRAKSGLDFDLPTEAQWEYACRAGTTTALNSGKNLTSWDLCMNMYEAGHYAFNATVFNTEYIDGIPLYTFEDGGGTATVGSYLPNQWGLYDMHGNVWEWCLDWYQSELGSLAQTDPRGAASASSRIHRGGCWQAYASSCRSASRDGIWLSARNNDQGFRLVRAVP